MKASRYPLRTLAAIAAVSLAFSHVAAFAREDRPAGTLRVCADPNNMPFSNIREEGFENKIAASLAQDLGWTLAYTWRAQRRGFVRSTLNSGSCDVIIGTPALDMLQVTQPYYRSGYVFVSRASDNYRLRSFSAPELRALRVGVQLIGDDGFNTPPAHALGNLNITGNVVGFPVYGDYRSESPPSTIVQALCDHVIDVAAVWGPTAGYYAKQARVPLRVARIEGTDAFRPLVFEFAIGMGVRKDDDAMRARLESFIERRGEDIERILNAYGVPLFRDPEEAQHD
jgi:quinoprotein dehydrogenase-associated probable ABC transporter substrate-binding protein